MKSPQTLSEMIRTYRAELSTLYPDDEIRNIGYLVTEHLLNYSKIDFHLKDQEPISAETAEKFFAVLKRLKNWEPVQYITGNTLFYGLSIRVDRRVLIPRPETEELVDWMVKENKDIMGHILDIGTGSGCIAIALAANLPHVKVSACDVSGEALTLARINAGLNGCNISFFMHDLLDGSGGLPEKYRIMVSNPPYVRQEEKSLMRRNVLDFEPGRALFVPDNDPLLYYRNIALLGRKHLQDGGKLYFEINENFSEEVIRLLDNTGFYGVQVRKDLNGKARMARGIK
jgi:release factor glutamine methyltransferase